MNRIKDLYHKLDVDPHIGNKRAYLATKAVLAGIGPPAFALGKRGLHHM